MQWLVKEVAATGCGCSSTVEPQPSKLMMWVRFPSPAPVVVFDESCPHSSDGRALPW